MRLVSLIGMLALIGVLSGCGDDQPKLSAYTPSGPLPASDEASPPTLDSSAPANAPVPVTPSVSGSKPAPLPASLRCSNPVPKILGKGRSTLAAGLLDGSPFLDKSLWTISDVQLFVESLDGTEQIQAHAFRSHLALIECQNTQPNSTLTGFASIPDSVMPNSGQYSNWLEVAVGSNSHRGVTAQAVLMAPLFRGNPIYRRIQDWRPTASLEPVRGVDGSALNVRVVKVDVSSTHSSTSPEPGSTVLVTESEVDGPTGKSRVYTRVVYSLE